MLATASHVTMVMHFHIFAYETFSDEAFGLHVNNQPSYRVYRLEDSDRKETQPSLLGHRPYCIWFHYLLYHYPHSEVYIVN